jgi:hypothetical protein
MQSGSAFHPEAENTPSKAREIIDSLAESLDCEPRNTSEEIRDCLLERNATDIVTNTRQLAVSFGGKSTTEVNSFTQWR